MLKMKKILALLLTAILLLAPLAYAEDAAIEPTAEAELTAEVEETVTPEPTEEPTPEPTEEPTPEPTEEPAPEPTEEPAPEPTEEPVPEPTEEPAPEPTEEPAMEEEPVATAEPEPEEELPVEKLPEDEELEQEENPIDTQDNSGTFGNLTWTLDAYGTLTISGTGAMPDSSQNAPWYSQRAYISRVVINYGVTSIGARAFIYCSYLSSVSIPSSVKSIGSYAFGACEMLPSISIPSSVTSIGECAFLNCTRLSLTNLTLSNGVIGKGAFAYCEGLSSISISDVSSIGEYAFQDCTSLKSVSLSGVKTIGVGAFVRCSSITSFSMGSGVKTISKGAFAGCSSLTSISIGSSVTSIGESAFEACTALKSVTIPNSVTSIGDFAFQNTLLTKITIPKSVTSIGLNVFILCKSLNSVTILNSNCSIYNNAYTLGYPENVTIYGYSGSTAQSFASRYKYKFVVYSAASSNTLATPKLTSVTNTATGVKIVWGKVSGASRYRVYYRVGTSGTFKKLVNTSKTSYTWTGAKSGTKYNFTVRCLDSAGELASSYDSKGKTITYVAAPKISSVSNTAKGVKISWGKVKGASRYRVYYRVGTTAKFTKLINTSAGSYTWTGAKSGTKYSFTVRALNSANEVISSYDSKGKTIKYVAAPKLMSVSNTTSGIKITWGKVTGASRYRVYYRVGTTGTFKKLVNTSAGSYTWTGAKSGTTYNFTVRALNSSNEVISSYDSKGKTITYKK